MIYTYQELINSDIITSNKKLSTLFAQYIKNNYSYQHFFDLDKTFDKIDLKIYSKHRLYLFDGKDKIMVYVYRLDGYNCAFSFKDEYDEYIINSTRLFVNWLWYLNDSLFMHIFTMIPSYDENFHFDIFRLEDKELICSGLISNEKHVNLLMKIDNMFFYPNKSKIKINKQMKEEIRKYINNIKSFQLLMRL